jgi:hypothetical protein
VFPSKRSKNYSLVNQLRDPAVFIIEPLPEYEKIYLFYADGGESGIPVTKLMFNDDQ